MLNLFLSAARFIEARATDLYIYALGLAAVRANSEAEQAAVEAERKLFAIEEAKLALVEARTDAAYARNAAATAKAQARNVVTAVNADADRVRTGAVAA